MLRLPGLINVKNRYFCWRCNAWVMRCTALLCRAILRPFMYGLSHVNRRCGHVSLSLLWHNVQLGFWYVRGQTIVFVWFLMYWAYLTIGVWVISGVCYTFGLPEVVREFVIY